MASRGISLHVQTYGCHILLLGEPTGKGMLSSTSTTAAPSTSLVKNIRNAGAIFLGRYTPEAIGDYVAGPNHVLPTARSARFSSGLGVTDFMKRSTLIACDENSLSAIGPSAVALANAEGLGAHARSVSIRLDVLSNK